MGFELSPGVILRQTFPLQRERSADANANENAELKHLPIFFGPTICQSTMADLLKRIQLFRNRSADEEGSHVDSSRRPSAEVETSRVKRTLFGPPDHEANLRFVRQEMERTHREAAQRWNFDFLNDRPLPGKFEWRSEKSTVAAVLTSSSRNNPLQETKSNPIRGDDRRGVLSLAADKPAPRPPSPTSKTATADHAFSEPLSSTHVSQSLRSLSGSGSTSHLSHLTDGQRGKSDACDPRRSSASEESTSSGPRCHSPLSSSTLSTTAATSTRQRSRSRTHQRKITDSFKSVKRSKSRSKIKTQERKSIHEQQSVHSPPSETSVGIDAVDHRKVTGK